MLAALKARLAERKRDEEGFTLIELMVVVLIIAILIAIAIPTFLGARQKAQDRAAQSDLRNALTAAKTAYVDTQTYGNFGTPALDEAQQLASIEPSLKYTLTSASDAPSHISLHAGGDTLSLTSLAADGTCWMIFETATGNSAGTKFSHTTAACTAPTDMSAGTWTDAW